MKKDKDKKKKRDKKELEIELLEPVKNSEVFSALPLRYFMEAVGGKWKISIIWALREQKGCRYGEIKTKIMGITDMMLSQSLRELATDGLVNRQQFQEIPPRVEYCITPKGAELLPALTMMVKWANIYGSESNGAPKQESGKDVH